MPEADRTLSLYQQIAEGLPIPSLLIDSLGKITYFNNSFLFNFQHDNLNINTDTTLESVFPESAAFIEYCKLLPEGPRGDGIQQIFMLPSSSGEVKSYHTNKIVFNSGDNDHLFLTLFPLKTELNQGKCSHLIGCELWDTLESLKEAVFKTTSDGEVLFISNAIEKILGYSKEEISNMQLADLYYEPEERSRLLEEIRLSGSLQEKIVKARHKSGTIVTCIMNASLEKDQQKDTEYLIGSLRDVSEDKLFRKLLSKSEQQHNILLEHAGAQIYYTGTDGTIVLASRLAAEFSGLTSDTLKGKKIAELFPENASKILQKNISRCLSERRGIVFELEVHIRDQSFWYFSSTEPVIEPEGEITGLVIVLHDITTRKSYDLEMQKLMIAVEQNSANITIINKNRVVEYVNPRFEEMTGYHSSEVQGKPSRLLSPSHKSSEMYHSMMATIESGKRWEGEIRNYKKDGTSYWEKVTISPVIDHNNTISHYVAVREDITQNRAARILEKKTRENLQLLNSTALRVLSLEPGENVFKILGDSLMNILPDCLFALHSYDSDSKRLKTEYLHTSRGLLLRFVRMINMSRKDFVYDINSEKYQQLLSGNFFVNAEGLYDFFHGKLNKTLSRSIETSLGMQEYYCRGIVKDNTLFGSISIVALSLDTEIDFDLLNPFLVQAAFSIEKSIIQTELLTEKQKAQEMNNLKTVFLANMSHELRTPLNGILGFSELLAEQADNHSAKDMLGVIHKSGLRLLDTLNTILDFSTLESGRIVLKYNLEDVSDLLMECLRPFSSEADRKGLVFLYKPSADPVKGFIVRGIVQKIVIQLVKNAIKFTNEGKIVVELKKTGNRKEKSFTISVKDTGIGITQEDQRHIFDEFRQGSEGFTRQFEGTGLGLTICKKFTDLLGGTIMVESKPGKGSTFTLILPFYDAEPLTAQKEQE